MNTVIYDAGVLVGADKNDRLVWKDHKTRLEFGFLLVVPAPVIAQVSRSSKQVQLRRLLSGCIVEPLDEESAHEAGRLLAKSKTTDIVDAVVVTNAIRRDAAIVTGHGDDIRRLVEASGHQIQIITI